MKNTITERDLFARISRKLARDGKKFHKNRGWTYAEGRGNYYSLDLRMKHVDRVWTCSLEEIGRELGVLADYEIESLPAG